MPTPEQDLVKEARELAGDSRFDIQPRVRILLRDLADEVERLRTEITERERGDFDWKQSRP